MTRWENEEKYVTVNPTVKKMLDVTEFYDNQLIISVNAKTNKNCRVNCLVFGRIRVWGHRCEWECTAHQWILLFRGWGISPKRGWGDP